MFRYPPFRAARVTEAPLADEAVLAEVRRVVAVAFERSRRRAETPLPATAPLRRWGVSRGLHLRRAVGRLSAPSRPRDRSAFVAVWCHQVEILGAVVLAYGSDAGGRSIRWVDDRKQLDWVYQELARTGLSVPVSIGSWQLA